MKKALSTYADLFKKYPNLMIVFSMVALASVAVCFSFLNMTNITAAHQFNEEENFVKDYTAKCESLHGTVVSLPYRCFAGKRILIKVRAQDVAQ